VKHVVFFDGICNLCNGWVDFLLPRLKVDSSLTFASLQGKAASELLKNPGLTSIVLWEDGAVFTESDAILRILGDLRRPWSWLRIFRVIPRRLRNALYRGIARRRYRWFGKRETCRVPPPEERARFQNRFLE